MQPDVEPTLRFERRPGPELAYHALAHVDLGRDAANLFQPGLPPRPWAAALAQAWTAAPGRLLLQALPLLQPDLARLLELLRWDPPRALQDPPGRALARLLATGIEELEPSALHAWRAATAAATQRLHHVHQALADRLTRLRAHLWAPQPPPPLVVLDCPSLGHHGRACQTREARLVAVACATTEDQLLLQILHEDAHGQSDPTLTGSGPPDTRPGQPGHALHQAREAEVIRRTWLAVANCAPELEPALAAWIRRVGGE